MSQHEILVVDDDPDIRQSIRLVLEKAGYRVREARDGRQALDELKRQRPDLVLLDIMMATDTEGFDLAFQLRKDPHFAELPIVLLTSFLDKVREEGPEKFQHILGEEWPAKWLFEKPVDTKRLLEKIAGILGGK